METAVEIVVVAVEVEEVVEGAAAVSSEAEAEEEAVISEEVEEEEAVISGEVEEAEVEVGTFEVAPLAVVTEVDLSLFRFSRKSQPCSPSIALLC